MDWNRNREVKLTGGKKRSDLEATSTTELKRGRSYISDTHAGLKQPTVVSVCLTGIILLKRCDGLGRRSRARQRPSPSCILTAFSPSRWFSWAAGWPDFRWRCCFSMSLSLPALSVSLQNKCANTGTRNILAVKRNCGIFQKMKTPSSGDRDSLVSERDCMVLPMSYLTWIIFWKSLT